MGRTSLIRLTDKDYDNIEELALDRGIAVATQIRIIILEYLKQIKK